MKNKPLSDQEFSAEYLNRILSYVLIVDDDPDDHQFLRESISRYIPETIVESVYDGEEAIRFLSNCSETPDLIVLDINMPRLNGLQTLELIRKNENLKLIPIVVFTVSTSDDHRKEMMEKGASAFYSKPAVRAEIDTIVQEMRDQYLWAKSAK